MNLVEIKKDEPPVDVFAVGAVVQLKSGGVRTTVRKTIKTKGAVMVTVDWMDAAETLNSAEFDARQLQAPKDDEMSSEDD